MKVEQQLHPSSFRLYPLSKALHWRVYGRKPSETNAIEYSIRLSIGSQQRLRGDFGGDPLLFSQHFK